MSSEAPPGDKPAVLIIGGLGYTGRNLTKYIHDNNLASEIRIVDKHLPELAWLAPEFKEACSRERFVQADASQDSMFRYAMDIRSSGEADNDPQGPFLESSTAKAANNSITYSTAAVRRVSLKRRRFTNYGHTDCLWH